MAIKALMVDVDGVLIDGRPEDGRPWHTSVHDDFGFTSGALHEHFFARYWDDIVVGRTGLLENLSIALTKFAPNVSPAAFASYWFDRDARLNAPLLEELSAIRARGIRVYLATNQEHLRAAHIMERLGLADHVDGMFYSAQLGTKKPNAEFFAKVQASVGLRGDEILLLDDSRSNIDAARQAGWRALHWTRDSSPNTVPSLCFDSFDRELE